MAGQIPENLGYTREHEWVDTTAEGQVRFGITDHAQDALGDIVFVTLPAVGAEIVEGQPCGEVESTKSVSDIYAPCTGRWWPATTPSRPAPRRSTPTRTAPAGSSRSRWPTRRPSATCSTPRRYRAHIEG